MLTRLPFPAIFCLLLLYGILPAQIGGNIVEKSVLNRNLPFTITSYSTRNGLPQNEVSHILRHKNGDIVAVTFNGIVAFNGYRFRTVNTEKSYRKQFFVSLHYFEKSDILLGQDWQNILYQISPTFEHIPLPGYRPLACLSDNDSLLVVSNTGSVYLYDPVKRKGRVIFTSTHAPNMRGHSMTSAAMERDKIYIGSSSGVFCIDLGKRRIDQLSQTNCHVIRKNPYNQRVYAVCEHQVYRIDDHKLSMVCSIQTRVPHGRAADMLFTDSNSIYISTDNGLIHTQGKQLEHYTKSDGLPSIGLRALYYDSLNHCMFVGSTEKGLLKLLFKNNYTLMLPDDEHYQKSITSVVHTGSNGFLALAGRNVYQIGEKEIRTLTSLRSDNACMSDINGFTYIGTWGDGVIICKNGIPVDTIDEKINLPDGVVHACFRDSRGRIWIGTEHGLAYGKSPDDVRPRLSNTIYKTVICFYELRDGRICVGTSNGAYIIDGDSIVSRFNHEQGFVGKEVRSFFENADGRLWIGTYGGGLYCYHKGRYTSVNALRNCMLYEDAFCVARDNFGYLYMTSNGGLWRVSEKNLNDFCDRKIHYLIPFHYTEESGFLNTEFNGGFQNNFQREGDHFIFPTIEGLVKTVPEKPIYSPAIASINTIRVNDTLLTDHRMNRFLRSTYSVQFEFECLNFIAKNNVYFQYRLAGETNYDWSIPQKQNLVTLNMLPPGKYTFMVRAIDAFNNPQPQVSTYSFEILPHVYETKAFLISAGILLVLGVSLLIRRRLSSNRRKIEQREYYRRKISELELHAIQAQLNPHFIFNCMNTIKYFILEKNFSYANEGLNRISKLIRNSMENSEKLFSPLRQEIIFITNYIELEKMRLRELLSYTITVADDIAPGILVPHLFIQPHVENAIKHGISNLESKQGILTIDIRQDERCIICTVEDNGIGRQASDTLLKSLPHISKGTRLTLEKSQLLKQYYNYHCTIEIIDLYNDRGESRGTRVVITMQKLKPGEI